MLRTRSACLGSPRSEAQLTRTAAGFRLQGATVVYNGKPALQNVDLTIEPGEAVAFVGPSGAGKTTLLRVLNGSLRPTGGQAQVDGKHMAQLSNKQLRHLRSHIGFVHQHLDLVPNLRVLQNVLAGRLGEQSLLASVKSMLFASRQELAKVHAILERVGIPEKLFERTDQLSGGQRQRVAIARALYQDPKAILADEPVASLDPARGKDVLELLARISSEGHMTLVMSLHDLALARQVFDRLIGMRNGRVVFDRPTTEIGEHEFQALYHLDAQEMLEDGC
ncbi:MAG: phosphonate ABC transporter ATP-binding protein [Planctomycetota bacterium]